LKSLKLDKILALIKVLGLTMLRHRGLSSSLVVNIYIIHFFGVVFDFFLQIDNEFIHSSFMEIVNSFSGF